MISFSSRYPTSGCERLTLWLFEKRLSATRASRSKTFTRSSVSPFDCRTHLRETADERLGHVAHGQLHDHFLDRVAHLGELRHADDLELQLLIVVGLGLHLPADEEEVVGEEVLAEILVVLAEKRELVRSVVVLQLEFAPRLAGLGHQVLHADDHTRHGDLLSLERVEILQLRELRLAHVVDDDLVVVERVRREIEPHHFALFREFLELTPVRTGRSHGTLDVHVLAAAEQALLGVVLLGLVTLSVAHELFDEGDAARIARIGSEELVAREVGDRIERPGVGQVLQAFAVHERVVHAFDEVIDVLEPPVGLPFGDDALHGRFSYALHGCETEAHVARGIGREGAHRLVGYRAPAR